MNPFKLIEISYMYLSLLVCLLKGHTSNAYLFIISVSVIVVPSKVHRISFTCL